MALPRASNHESPGSWPKVRVRALSHLAVQSRPPEIVGYNFLMPKRSTEEEDGGVMGGSFDGGVVVAGGGVVGGVVVAGGLIGGVTGGSGLSLVLPSILKLLNSKSR